MKRTIEFSKTQEGALAVALLLLLAACAFALLHAMGGADASTSLIAPLFLGS